MRIGLSIKEAVWWARLGLRSPLLPLVGDKGGRSDARPDIQWRHEELNLRCSPSGNPAGHRLSDSSWIPSCGRRGVTQVLQGRWWSAMRWS